MSTSKKSLYLFLVITLILSAIVETAILLSGEELLAATLIAVLMWIPALAGLISKLTYFRKEKGALGFRKCQWKYIWAGLLIPLFYIAIPYIIYWIVFPGTLQFAFTPAFIVIVILCVPSSMITALGEEIGWRGFMVPKMLEVWGLEKMLIASSAIWCIWHMPLLISGMYMAGTPLPFKLIMFVINIGSVGVIAGILTIRAKSVWPAAFIHAAHNAYDQSLFGVYTTGDKMMYLVSETGILTAILTVGIAVYMYINYKKINTASEAESIA